MRSIIFVVVALFAINISVYWNVGNNEFISFDDIGYVCSNEHVLTGINKDNVVWAFTSHYKCNWHPITWLSHMVDVQIYGMNPRGHHLTNVIIHTVTTLIVFIFLLRLTRSIWKSAFVAALFGLHPLHVESVAWVAERKDVLSALFWFLTLLLYAEYVRGRKLKMYFLSIIIFVLGIMSKPMLVTLPLIMLLMDFWPLDRYDLCRKTTQSEKYINDFSLFQLLLKEKIPFFVISVVSAVITIYAQYQGGAIKSIDFVPMSMRLANACTVYVKYIAKMFWPTNLAVLYPLPNSIPLWQVICSLLVLVIITAGVIHAGRRQPYLAVGWFWFIITLAPVIGLIQVGSQSMADRYTYIPLTGLFIAISWGVPFLVKNLSRRKIILVILSTSIIIIMSILTFRQIGYWKDSITLYEHSLRVAPGSAIIHNNLGLALAENGNIDMAIEEYKKAIYIYKNYTEAYYNMGLSLAEKGYIDEAIEEYKKAIFISPNFTMAHNNLGASYASKGYLSEAIDEYRTSIKIDPYYPIAHYNLGLVLDEMNCHSEAISEFRKAIEINPDYIDAKNSLNNALEKQD